MPGASRTFLAMNRILGIAWLAGLMAGSTLLTTSCAAPPPSPTAPHVQLPAFRAPAVPLFVQTPYLHTWLCGDRLADEAPKLWNGQIKGMAGILRIDGKAYRFMGLPTSPLPALRQDQVRVLPTRTVFEFSQDDVRLRLEFLSPMDPRDLRLLSLPVGLLRAEVTAEKPRSIQLYFDITGEWAVGSSDRRITWDGLFRIRPSQPRLFRETYNYPDWGDVHWLPVDPATSWYGIQDDVRQAFAKGGSPKRDSRYPRAANDEWPVFAHQWDLGKVDKPVVRRALLGHTRAEIADFYGKSCPAYWTRHYRTGSDLMAAVASDFETIRARTFAVDDEVITRAHAAGGPALACLAALAFRQSFAANELALHGDQVFYFSKSMDISGVSAIQSLDVIYPSSSALLAFNPALLRMQLAPILMAIRRGDWREPHAMSDLGSYPAAAGQQAPGPARPESTAQLLLLARMAWGAEPVPELAPFAATLAGAEASLRGALAVGTAPKLDGPRDQVRADYFVDRLLGTRLVPKEEVARELAELKTKAGKYGTPFDGRKSVVRVDALLWLAALADPADRPAIAGGALKFYAETASRVPAPDQYEGDTGRSAGTQARPVLGAVFAPLLVK